MPLPAVVHGEIGLMQVKPATARMVRSLTGVRAGSLAVPANNLRIGMAYLNWCYRRAKRNVGSHHRLLQRRPGQHVEVAEIRCHPQIRSLREEPRSNQLRVARARYEAGRLPT